MIIMNLVPVSFTISKYQFGTIRLYSRGKICKQEFELILIWEVGSNLNALLYMQKYESCRVKEVSKPESSHICSCVERL